MATRPHLSQIQSSNPKYNNLLEEILDINSNIDHLNELGINAIVDSYEELLNIDNKAIGFYLVRRDETYRNNPTQYFYEGNDFKMVGGRISEGILKKTVVFYIKRYSEKGQSIQLYVPYKGHVNSVTLCNPSGVDLSFKLWDGYDLIGEFESDSEFMEWVAFHSVDNPTFILEMVGDMTGVENINVNVDIVIE